MPDESGPNILLIELTGPAFVFARSVAVGVDPPRNFQPLQIATRAATATRTIIRVLRDSLMILNYLLCVPFPGNANNHRKDDEIATYNETRCTTWLCMLSLSHPCVTEQYPPQVCWIE